MKYLLTKFIRRMRVEEVRYYKIFNANYTQKGKEKRTVELFDALYQRTPDEYDASLSNKFFSNKNRNAYYRLKNRLLHDLEHSMITFHIEEDEEFIIMNKIKLASIFLQRTAYEEAQNYLEEAEKLAIKQQAYNLLNVIYDKFIQLCHLNYTLNPTPFLEKKQAIQAKHEQIQQNELLLATISYQLHRSNFSTKEEGVIETLEQIQNNIQLTDKESISHELRLRINQCARKILLQKREFEALSEYLHDSFIEFNHAGIFTNKNQEEKIIMLIWLVNAFVRVKDVDKTIQFTNQLKDNLDSSNQALNNKYLWLYCQCKMMVDIIQKKPERAIETLENLLHNPTYSKILNYFSLYLNLSMLNYYCQNINESIDYIGKIVVSKDYRSISRHLQINIGIVELALRYETQDYDYALNRYKELRRKYRKELTQKTYTEQKQFLEILRDMLTKPGVLNQARMQRKVSQFIAEYSHFEIGGNELLDYSLWLKSKVEKRPYYELMLDAYYEE